MSRSVSPSETLSLYGGTTTKSSDLSTLPDDILCLILSFLPTKQVVATSVLSKRWKPLWRSVSILDFEDRVYYHGSKDDYARLVHSVSALILHLHHPIHKFRIRCWAPRFRFSCSAPECMSPFTDPANVTIWVNAAVQRRGLHQLHLCLSRILLRQPPINLCSIFTCKTLVVLKLQNINFEPISSVDLPLLKAMHLERVRLPELGCVAELLSGCPVLEDFIESDLYFQRDYLIHEFVPDTRFRTLTTLLRADICAYSARILLEVVNNVKFLHIDEINNSLYNGTDLCDFPMFHNLTHIQLEYRYYGRNNNDNDWSDVVELLKHCPKIQVLVIQKHYHVSEANWQFPPSMLHLKRCTEDDQIKFARYIMEDSKEDDNMQWHF